jgi:enterochelin esterase-like enzyme
MKPRQAAFTTAALLCLSLVSACTPTPAHAPTLTASPLPAAPPDLTATTAPVSIPVSATAAIPACTTQGGRVEAGSIAGTPPQEFLIYLPPCYDESPGERYPVVYLLHGQTYNQDQWVHLGAPDLADGLIRSGESAPFILVFPDDRYWNLPAGGGFGERLVNAVIPYVDRTYRTRDERAYRSLGGLSRGGGWAAQVGFDHPELFNAIGLHSPAIFMDHAPFLEKIVAAIPSQDRPRLWLDIGDADPELGRVLQLEQVLTRTDSEHEFHLFSGDHTETYWNAHVDEYLRWYARAWQPPAGP